jgi:hypothetical protein
MADEQDNKEKKTVSESLRDWGIDVEKFEERAKESLGSARDDLSEIAGTLRHTLVQAKEIVVGLQKNGAPVAAELKSGFERAWHEIESAFRAAREKAKERKDGEAPPPPPSSESGSNEPPPAG